MRLLKSALITEAVAFNAQDSCEKPSSFFFFHYKKHLLFSAFIFRPRGVMRLLILCPGHSLIHIKQSTERIFYSGDL